MLTLRAAASLLASADSLEGLTALARLAGCTGSPAPLDQDTRRALGIGAWCREVTIVPGRGSLRALVIRTRREVSMRETLAALAARLSTRAAHASWLVVAGDAPGTSLALAAWSGDRHPPRVAALLCDRGNIVDSDADTARALGAAADGDSDLVVHARWVDVLGRESLSRRFFRTLEHRIDILARTARGGHPEQCAEVALLYASRLLFLAFLEAKGWLDGDPAFLAGSFDRCMAQGSGYHERVLLPLFFGTLNTRVRRRAAVARAFGRVPFLNGGLFAPTPVERSARGLRFGDEALGALFDDLFRRYRFTAHEESSALEEAAVDPEMLGRTFESLMASRTRRSTGAFYTPHALVRRTSDAALHDLLAHRLGEGSAERLLSGATLSEMERRAAAESIADLRILDPACGSGAFLVHLLERVADLRTAVGETAPPEAVRRDVLTRTIFGVDCNPTAVWLCQLRLWLSVVIQAAQSDPSKVEPLPNLDRNVRVGDTLAGDAFSRETTSGRSATLTITRLRRRYARSSGARKVALSRALDREERRAAVAETDARLRLISLERRRLLAARRGKDLFGAAYHPSRGERVRAEELRVEAAALRRRRASLLVGAALPFSFGTQFADVGARGGFDLIVGNPPWVRPHRLDERTRESLRHRFRVARDASWAFGAAASGAGAGFGGQVDVAALFVERSLDLLAGGGTLALVLPAKLWRSLAGGGVRGMLSSEAHVTRLEDHSEGSVGFDAVTYPSILVARRRGAPATVEEPIPCVRLLSIRRGEAAVEWRSGGGEMPWDDTPGAPWLLLPRAAREAFDELRACGTPLGESVIGRPLLGVKCGCNDAFIVRGDEWGADLVRVRARDGRTGLVERELLRPIVRGEQLAPWRCGAPEEWIVWTHDAGDRPMARVPAHAAAWLRHWRSSLVRRSDMRPDGRWWSLFRTEGARYERPRVVWPDLARSPRAFVVPSASDVVPLNSCYVARCRDDEDAYALAAVLNSALAAAWLAPLAEPARGGYRRYLAWTMALLPLPRNWAHARLILAPLGRLASSGVEVHAEEMLQAVLESYALPRRAVAPLIAWNGA